MKTISISDFFSTLQFNDKVNILKSLNKDCISVPSNINIMVNNPRYQSDKIKLYGAFISFDKSRIVLAGHFSSFENYCILKYRKDILPHLKDNILIGNDAIWVEEYSKMHGRRKNTVDSTLSQAIDKILDKIDFDNLTSYYNIIKDRFVKEVEMYEKKKNDTLINKQLEIIEELERKFKEQKEALFKGEKLPYITKELSLEVSNIDNIIIDTTNDKNALYDEIDRLVYPLDGDQKEILRYYMKNIID